MGEITVLALAGIGVYTLLKLRPHSNQTEEKEPATAPELKRESTDN